MKNNKGFTLIELIGIIVVLVAIFLVAFPSLLGTTKQDEEKLYTSMVDDLCLAGETYIYSHIDDYPEISTPNSKIYINISNLIKDGSVSKNKENPKTGEIINNHFVIFKVLSDNSLSCEYKDETCLMTNDEDKDELLDIGDEVTCGSESFYVIDSDDHNVQLLTKYRLSKTTLIQISKEESEEEKIAYILEPNNKSIININSVTFSSTPYWLENKSQTNGKTKSGCESKTGSYCWIFDENEDITKEGYIGYYIYNYEKKLTDIGVSIISSKLMSYDQAIKLGCVDAEEDTCENAPEWVTSTSYWLGTYSYVGSLDFPHRIWSIDADESFDRPKYNEGYESGLFNKDVLYHGVRPVIIVPINLIS